MLSSFYDLNVLQQKDTKRRKKATAIVTVLREHVVCN